jgi:hypothetical protein
MRKLFLTLIFGLSVLILNAQLSTNLTAWWSFDETSGTVMDDAIGSNNGTASAGLTVGSTTSLSGRSIFFDSNLDYVTLTSAITQTTGTYSFWIRPTSIPDDMVILGSNGYQSRIFIGVGNNIKYESNTNNDEFPFYFTFSTDTWYHIVMVRDANEITLYRNGTALQTVALSTTGITINSIGISGRSFRGYIDEVAIWSRALDNTEVGQLYNSGNPLKPPFNSAPTVTTTTATGITGSTASSGGNATDDGGSAITAKGVCWSTSINPVVTGSHTNDGTGEGSFTSTLTGLSTNSTYYYRAYATNAIGTSYGTELSFSTGTVTLLSNIISYWKLDELSGLLVDVVSAHNGTLSGALYNAAGKYGRSIDFDATNDYIKMADHADWTVNTTDNITLSAWVWFDGEITNSTNYATIIGQDVGPAFSLKWISNGNYQMTWYCGGVAEATSTTQAYSFGQWYHIAMSKVGNSVSFYRNGTLVNTVNSLTDINTNPTAFYIGGDEHATPEVFNGKIDEVAYWKRNLSAAEIATVANSTTTYPFITLTQPTGSTVNFINGNQYANSIFNAVYYHTVPRGHSPNLSFYVYPLKHGGTDVRYIVDQENKPFFWSGDAGWSLLTQATTPEAKIYLANRSLKGFSVIMTNMLEHYFADNAPNNIYNVAPFSGTAFQSTPNEAYFAHIDTIIREAEKKNIIMLLGPTYLGYSGGTEGWATEIGAASTANMQTFGEYIGNRYKNFKNIIWFIGGDRNPTVTPNVLSKLNYFVNGLRTYDDHLITFHGPSESYGTDNLASPAWLDINNVYTRSKTIHTWYKTAYEYNPTGLAENMPFVQIEGAYENDPGHVFTDAEQRNTMYSSILNGAFGYTFGNIPLFAFGFTVAGLSDWQTAMNDVQSVNMNYFQKLFRSRSWNLLVPDWNNYTLISGYGTYGTSTYVSSALTSNGNTFIAYIPTGNTTFAVNLSRISGDSSRCWWYNPATSDITLIGKYPNTETNHSFTSPNGDQVLVIDNSSLALPHIGTITYPIENPSEDNFSGKVLYVDINGDNTNTGLTETSPITISGISAKLNNTFDYIAFSDTAHYGILPINSIVRPYGNPLIITTWHKYGTGNASIKGLTQLTTWSQSGNYWTKSSLTGLPKNPNRIYNPTYLYTITHMNGLYINGTWYGVSKYPNTKTYYSIESGNGSSTLRDNQGVASSNYWTGATLVSENPTWVNGKYQVTGYASDGTYTVTSMGDQQMVASGMKYFLINHRNAEDINGEWSQNYSTNAIEVYYTGDLNSQSVYAPLVDSVVGVTNSSYITIQNINFYGGNKEHIKIYNSIGTNINHCNFYRSPVAGIANFASTGTSCTYNNFYYPNDNGILAIASTDETYSSNYMKGVGIDGTFGGGRDGTHLIGIITTGYKGFVNIKYNRIDSTGYCGIALLNGTSTNTGVNVYRNFINNAMMTVSDGGAIYTFFNPYNANKSVRGNIIMNTYNNSAFHRSSTNFVESKAIYMDEGYPNGCTSCWNRKWVIDSNFVYAFPQGLFQNVETRKIIWKNNILAKSISYGTYSDYGYTYNPSGNDVDSARVTKNKFIAGYNSGGNSIYLTSWDLWSSPTSEKHNLLDSNDYYNPFGSDLSWLTNSGSPNYTRTYRTLTYARSVSTWEDHSTFNKNSWTFAQTSGITQDQFIWFFVNWSGANHTFSLGSTVFMDLDGNSVSGTFTLAPYKARVLFYVSGGLGGLPNPVYADNVSYTFDNTSLYFDNLAITFDNGN